MSYKNHEDMMEDFDYFKKLDFNGRSRHEPFGDFGERISFKHVARLKIIWEKRTETKYDETKNTNTNLGKFIKKYNLRYNEFRCLINTLNKDLEKSDFEKENNIQNNLVDYFKKFKVRYESSNLKKQKLIFKITDPLRPLKVYYEVSFKAQLELTGKKYSDEYQQLDMALEEESKRNSPDQLESLYFMTTPTKTFNELIVSNKIKDDLKTAVSRELQKDKIMKTWGIGKVIDYGKGTTLNFRGPPGTGKTLAANVLANTLQKKLLVVRYDQIQNMYVGNSEKNIHNVFKIAKAKDAVLFFDEADAIAHNRETLERSYEMSQVNTLLKELERFEGICIFATNFADKFDPAFERRLTMHIDFELPTTEQARKILEVTLPKKAIEERLNLNELNIGGLSGGDIKNVVLNSAGIAAKEEANKIGLKHLQQAIEMTKKTKVDETERQVYHG